jgi:hypothetical protein
MIKSSSLFDTSPLTCNECRDLLDAAAGFALVDVSLEQGMPGVAHHIATCANCREEYDSLVHVLRVAPGLVAPRLSSMRKSPKLGQIPPRSKPGNNWVIPAPVLADRWFTSPSLAQARAVTSQPAMFERRLLLAEIAETQWGLAGLEIVAQRQPDSPDHVEIQVQVAFDTSVSEPVRVILEYANQTFAAVLDERGHARFADIALSSLFEVDAKQATSDLSVSLSPATEM